MKKKTVYFMFILMIIALLLSCEITHKLVLDESNPANDNAVIKFIGNSPEGSFRFIEFNAVNIQKELYKGLFNFSGDSDSVVLVVPSGTHSYTFDVTFHKSFSNTSRIFRGVELEYDLKPGREYTVKGRTRGLFSTEYFIGIYDTTKGSELIKEWKIGES